MRNHGVEQAGIKKKKKLTPEEKDAQMQSSSNIARSVLLSEALTFDPVTREPIVTAAYNMAHEVGLIVCQTCARKKKSGNIPRGCEVTVRTIPEKQVKGSEKVIVMDSEGNEAIVLCRNLHFIPHQGANKEIPPYVDSNDESDEEPDAKKPKKGFELMTWEVFDEEHAQLVGNMFVQTTLFKLLLLQGANQKTLGVSHGKSGAFELRVLKAMPANSLYLFPYTDKFVPKGDKRLARTPQIVLKIDKMDPEIFLLAPYKSGKQVVIERPREPLCSYVCGPTAAK